MKVNYLIADRYTGEVVETGVGRIDLARARAKDGQLFVMHDGSLGEITSVPSAELADPELLYGLTDAGIAGSPIVESTDPEVSVIAVAQHYLQSTDWYVVRQIETGMPVPEDVSAKRSRARLIVSETP